MNELKTDRRERKVSIMKNLYCTTETNFNFKRELSEEGTVHSSLPQRRRRLVWPTECTWSRVDAHRVAFCNLHDNLRPCKPHRVLEHWKQRASIPLRIKTDEQTGRTYRASRDILAQSTILDVSTPYTYTIWKQFRNEVCAECWRYEGGRRGFLTRRDDDGIQGGAGRADKGSGAGLWFCDARCQAAWLEREGLETFHLMRTLEHARCRKESKAKQNAAENQRGLEQITQERIDHAWSMIQQERKPKEMNRWRELQMDNFEADMARYVLLALVHLHREKKARIQTDTQNDSNLQAEVVSTDSTDDRMPVLELGNADWTTFASLQSNELQHLRTYPDLLENQIRIYQCLKGRFGTITATDHGSTGTNGMMDDAGKAQDRAAGQHNGASRIWQAADWLRDFGSVVTVDNVRMALSVDPGNSFGIWEVPLTEESECLGFAVYPQPSFFNHHCSPNVRKERSGRALRFVATRAVNTSEELCISYGHVEGMSWQDRQKELGKGGSSSVDAVDAWWKWKVNIRKRIHEIDGI